MTLIEELRDLKKRYIDLYNSDMAERSPKDYVISISEVFVRADEIADTIDLDKEAFIKKLKGPPPLKPEEAFDQIRYHIQ